MMATWHVELCTRHGFKLRNQRIDIALWGLAYRTAIVSTALGSSRLSFRRKGLLQLTRLPDLPIMLQLVPDLT